MEPSTERTVREGPLPTTDAIELDALPLAEPVDLNYEQAAEQLEKVIQAGSKDKEVFYLLAMAYKQMEDWSKARETLRKIKPPDANVLLQMGILSLKENLLAQAEGELVRALQLDENSFTIGYNLILTRLSLGQGSTAIAVFPGTIQNAPTQNQARHLTLLQGLLELGESSVGTNPPRRDRGEIKRLFDGILDSDESQLLDVIQSLAHVEMQHRLLKALVSMCNRSPTVREAYFETVLLKARSQMQRCSWTEAQSTLTALVHQKSVARENQAILHNLLGCCATVLQDFEKGKHHFDIALRSAGSDLRFHQNIALTLELQNKLSQAEDQWNETIDLLEQHRCPAPPDQEEYHESLAFACLGRLAQHLAEKERWGAVVRYLERAYRLRPFDDDVTERLFHAYQNADQKKAAQKMLQHLRELRPHDPQVELYELDLVEVNSLQDIEYLLTEIENIIQRHPDDHRVEERALGMVHNVVPLMGNLCDQLTDQLSKVYRQVRNLPRYQIDWSALNEIVRDLIREFRKLKRITAKCLPLVTHHEHRRVVQDLKDHIDEKIDACRRLLD